MKTITRKKHTKHIYTEDETVSFLQAKKGLEQSLKALGQSFIRKETSQTATYFVEKETYSFFPDSSDIAGHGMNFIKKVKDHFSQMEKPTEIGEGRPFYERFKPISTYRNIRGVCEIDLNKAYWEIANQLGYLSEELYQLAFSPQVPKKARLIALGILGKKTVTTKFDPPYKSIKPETQYANTRIFWDNIVWVMGELMKGVWEQYEPHLYGMWFDALFVDEIVSRNVREYLRRRGFSCTKEKIGSYIIKPREKSIIPGAKIVRIFTNGKKKEMDVSYHIENSVESFDNFMYFVERI